MDYAITKPLKLSAVFYCYENVIKVSASFFCPNIPQSSIGWLVVKLKKLDCGDIMSTLRQSLKFSKL